MRVAIVHDDLTQWGGAERVLVGITETFPDAPIYTLAFDSGHPVLAKQLMGKKIYTSFIQKIPGWHLFFKATMPLHPFAFEQFDFSSFDVVISQTTRFAKAIITKPETVHICYCHTPPRFLWLFSGEKIPLFIKPVLRYLRFIDYTISKRPDMWLAGSKNAQDRIKKVYQQESLVLYPFIDEKRFANTNTIKGDYFVIIARLNQYKRVDIAVKAFAKSGKKLKVIGVGPQLKRLKKMASPNIEFLGAVDEKALLDVLAGCQALIVTAEEDFGLTPLEAQALGKPVIAFQRGGVLETVIDGKTGVLFPQQTVESLQEAIDQYEGKQFDQKQIQNHVKQFFKSNFKTQLAQFVAEATK